MITIVGLLPEGSTKTVRNRDNWHNIAMSLVDGSMSEIACSRQLSEDMTDPCVRHTSLRKRTIHLALVYSTVQ
jgi:hypothetical protein